MAVRELARETEERNESSPLNGDSVVTTLETSTDYLKRKQEIVKERFLRKAETHVATRRHAISESKAQLKDAGWIDTLSGTKACLERDIEIERKILQKEEAKVREIKAALELAHVCVERAESLKQRGMIKDSSHALEEAEHALKSIDLKIDSKEYMEALRNINEGLQRSVKKINTATTVTKVVRDGAVIAGATVATGGVLSPALMAGANVFVAGAQAVAVGTLAGSSVGLGSNVAEALVDLNLNDKTAAEVAKNALRQTGKDALSSFIASSSTAATLGVGNGLSNVKAIQTLTSGLGTTGQRVASGVLGGAITGGTSGAFMATANTAVQYTQARIDFSKLDAQHHWSEEERGKRFIEFLASRGLTISQVLKNGAVQVLAGAAGGAIGGGTSAVQQSVRTATTRCLVTGGAVAADGAIGIGAAALQGDLSKERVTQILGATIVGHTVGHFYQRAELSKKPTLEKGIDLLTERYGTMAAEEFKDNMGRMSCKELGLEPTPENIKIAHDLRLKQAGTDGALQSMDELASQVKIRAREALTPDNVAKITESEFAKGSEKLCRHYKLDQITDKHTTAMLHDVTNSSQKKLAENFIQLGVASQDAVKTAKVVKQAFASGRYDLEIKLKLEDRITSLVSYDLKKGMEVSFKETFHSGLNGTLKAPQAERLQAALQERGIKLLKTEIDELTDAGWLGAQRGIERGVRKVVREGIDSAFDRFRRGRGVVDQPAPRDELIMAERIRNAAPEILAHKTTVLIPEASMAEIWAQQSQHRTEQVLLGGRKFERVLARERDGSWQQVALNQLPES